MGSPWEKHTAVAFGELYEVAAQAAEIALTSSAAEYPWIHASPGALDPSGLVRAEAADVEGWFTGRDWAAGTIVAHDGNDWQAAVAVPAQVLVDEELVDSPEPGAVGDTNWTDLGARGARLVIGTGGAGVYRVQASATFEGSAAAVITWAVHLNRVAVPRLSQTVALGSVGDPAAGPAAPVGISGLLVLQDGDVLDLHAQASANTKAVTPHGVNLSIVRLN